MLRNPYFFVVFAFSAILFAAPAAASDWEELNPKFAGGYNARGIVYAKKGELDRAIADFTRAIELNPKLAGLSHNRASAYQAQGDFQRAAADRAKAAEPTLLTVGVLRCLAANVASNIGRKHIVAELKYV